MNRAIDERNARGNPPELQAKLDRFSERFRRFRQLLIERRDADPSGNGSKRLFPEGKFSEMFHEWMAREDELEKQRSLS